MIGKPPLTNTVEHGDVLPVSMPPTQEEGQMVDAVLAKMVVEGDLSDSEMLQLLSVPRIAARYVLEYAKRSADALEGTESAMRTTVLAVRRTIAATENILNYGSGTMFADEVRRFVDDVLAPDARSHIPGSWYFVGIAAATAFKIASGEERAYHPALAIASVTGALCATSAYCASDPTDRSSRIQSAKEFEWQSSLLRKIISEEVGAMWRTAGGEA